MKSLKVVFSDQALARVEEKEREISNLMSIITGVLENDPRPAYRAGQKSGHGTRVFGIRIFDFDLKWTVEGDFVLVIDLEPVNI